jgi:mono/diheme cytochrome c family protein
MFAAGRFMSQVILAARRAGAESAANPENKMKIKPFVLVLAAFAAALALQPPSASRAAEPLDGKAVFLAQKCEGCHAVAAAGIAATTKIEKMKGPDLSGHPMGDLAETGAFLRQEKERDGVKHKKAVKASAEEIEAMLRWLASLKKPAAGGP